MYSYKIMQAGVHTSEALLQVATYIMFQIHSSHTCMQRILIVRVSSTQPGSINHCACRNNNFS
jgi:hypothetical protein